MGSIYKTARCVDVWLGKAERPRSVIDLQSKLREWFSEWLRIVRINLRFARGNQYLWALMRQIFDLQRYLALWDALRNIPEVIEQAIDSTEPCWLNRAWVLQEFSLAQRVIFWCGSTAFQYREQRLRSLDSFSGRNLGFRRFSFRVRLDMSSRFRERLRQIDQKRRQGKDIKRSECVDIFQAADVIEPYESTYLGDLVFSLLGMISTEEAKHIGSDCNASATEVFARATYASIRFRNNFDVLSHRSPETQLAGLPSWSLDFSQPTQKHCTDILEHTAIPLHANGSPSLSMLDHTVKLLSIHAAPLGVVLDSFSVFREGRLQQMSSQDLWQFTHRNSKLVDYQEFCEYQRGFVNVGKPLSLRLERYELSQEYEALFHDRLNKAFVEAYESNDAIWEVQLPDIFSEVFALWASLSGTRAYKRTDSYLSRSAIYDRSDLSLFVTSAGLIGIARETISREDTLVLIPAAHPFVALRGTGEFHTFQGNAWVWGIEEKEVTDNWDKLDFTWKKFVLC